MISGICLWQVHFMPYGRSISQRASFRTGVICESLDGTNQTRLSINWWWWKYYCRCYYTYSSTHNCSCVPKWTLGKTFIVVTGWWLHTKQYVYNVPSSDLYAECYCLSLLTIFIIIMLKQKLSIGRSWRSCEKYSEKNKS